MLRDYPDILTTEEACEALRVGYNALFRAAVCEWLGKTLEPEVVPEDELAAFCEAHLGQELNEQEIQTVRTLIVKAAGATGFVEPQPTRVATLGREALNNRMGKFNSPYRFEKSVWKIMKEE